MWKIRYMDGMTYFDFVLYIDQKPFEFLIRDDSKFVKVRKALYEKIESNDDNGIYLFYRGDHLITDEESIKDYYGSHVKVVKI